MSRSLSRVSALVVASSAFPLLGVGCQPGGEPPPVVAPGFDREGMLTNLADEVILPTLREFVTASEGLASACAAWAGADGEGAAAARTDAQAAFHRAMDLWQEAEVMQVGPAGMAGTVMGGRDMRDEIYSWPSTNRCAVDEAVVAERGGDAAYFETQLVSVSGLDALEYVLFAPDDDNACPAERAINSQGTWDALGPAAIAERRARYCRGAAAHLVDDARALRDAWEPEAGNFRAGFVAPGRSGSAYDDPGDAIDGVYAAMFYVELRVKDRKLAVPAGLHVDCVQESCPELAESRYAKRSKENLAANLRGFEKLYTGLASDDDDAGLGFDDFLAEANAGELAQRMQQSLDDAQAAVDAFDGTLEDALASDVGRVRALHATLKTLTDDLKSQMPSVLGLRVPQEGAGDND